jgi:hypothetical protein
MYRATPLSIFRRGATADSTISATCLIRRGGAVGLGLGMGNCMLMPRDAKSKGLCGNSEGITLRLLQKLRNLRRVARRAAATRSENA